MIDFSENSDSFADRGATISEIWNLYYLNYIPEMFRLVSPVAVFVACLFLTGQLTERMEITALKAAGVSLYRLSLPYLVFAGVCAASVSYLDAYIIPKSNATKIDFERKYLQSSSENIDRNNIYRQISNDSFLKVEYYDRNQDIAYRVNLIRIQGENIKSVIFTPKMTWLPDQETWRMTSVTESNFSEAGFSEIVYAEKDTLLNIFPRDLARTTSDIYLLTYTEALEYIASIERSGAGNENLPKVQLFGRMAYPFSIIVVIIIGFAIAAVKRNGGKGFYLAAGLAISFLYLAFMKIIEPFGSYGEISPELAALLPHAFFLATGIFLLIQAKK